MKAAPLARGRFAIVNADQSIWQQRQQQTSSCCLFAAESDCAFFAHDHAFIVDALHDQIS
jgi:hypothetical protein